MKIFLTTIIISLFFLPAIIPNTSIRIDNILILFFGTILFLTRKYTISSLHKNIYKNYLRLFLFIFFALFLQSIFIRNAYDIYFLNFQGFFRLVLVIVLFSNVIAKNDSEYFIKLILFGIIYIGFISIIQSFDLKPFSSIINFIYRGDQNAMVGSAGGRALGVFTEVHNQAYFQLYTLLFLLTIDAIKSFKNRILYKFALLLSLLGLVFSYSRSAWLTFLIVFIFFKYKSLNFKKIFIGFFVLNIILIIIYNFILSEIITYQISAYLESIVEGGKYLITFNDDLDAEKIGFITARLNWGWLNALNVWSENKVFGDISYGSRHDLFIGDGGYTEILANHGTIGFIGFLLFIFNTRKNSRNQSISNLYFKSMSITFILGAFAVGIFRERSMEILPIYMMIITKYEYDNKEKYPFVY